MSDQVGFIRREPARKEVTPLELIVGKALPSVIALACGKRKNGLINALGTGFAIGTSSKDGQTLFCTCEHIIEELLSINSLTREEGIKNGFIDNYIRVAWQCVEFAVIS